jgi:hypothetical protein
MEQPRPAARTDDTSDVRHPNWGAVCLLRRWNHGEMLYAYVDESYIEGEVYLVGALVLTRNQVDAVTFGLEEVLWRTNQSHPEIPLDIEFHGQQLFQRSGVWNVLRLQADDGRRADRPALGYSIYRRAIGKIARTGGKWFIAGVRRPDRIATRYPSDPWPPHALALQFCLERVSEYAASIGERVCVIADNVQNQALHEARMRVFQDRGHTMGWMPRDLNHIDPGFQWVDSRDHRPLQACDMLTYVYLRKRFVTDTHHRPKAEIVRLRDIAVQILQGTGYIWTP